MNYEVDERILQPAKLPVVRDLFGASSTAAAASRSRFTSPSGSYYDRFIPCRANNNWHTSFATLPDYGRANTGGAASGRKTSRDAASGGATGTGGEQSRDTSAYCCLLKNELLGDTIDDVKQQQACDGTGTAGAGGVTGDRHALTPVKNRGLFRYGTPKSSNDISSAVSLILFLRLIIFSTSDLHKKVILFCKLILML